jgi:Protein of unknown function (DUF3307)
VSDPVLVLAWLILAHLVADFVVQTERVVRAKNDRGGDAVMGLALHALGVGACLIPVGLAWGGPGWAYLAWSVVLHVVIDRTKIVATRRAASTALAGARRVDATEAPSAPDHLGRAWTSAPAALFLVDQCAHLVVAGVGWLVLLQGSSLQSGWVAAANSVLGNLDPRTVHRVVSVLVVLLALTIVNVRAAAIWVAILVRPVEEGNGAIRWGNRSEPAPAVALPTPPSGAAGRPARRWSLRLGPIDAGIVEEALPESAESAPPVDLPRTPGQVARVGATIGILERVLIVVFVLTGTEAAIGFVVAAKTLARFRLLDDRDFAEYYLLGTLGSVAVAIVTALVGRVALSALLG